MLKENITFDLLFYFFMISADMMHVCILEPYNPFISEGGKNRRK